MGSIFKSTVMSATKQVSHARNVLLFSIFQINLQIVLRGRRGGHLMMSLVWVAVVPVLVLEPLPALWENVEIKSSGGELVTVIVEVKRLAKSHSERSGIRFVSFENQNKKQQGDVVGHPGACRRQRADLTITTVKHKLSVSVSVSQCHSVTHEQHLR